jgi:CDP-paratose 2-epimerase
MKRKKVNGKAYNIGGGAFQMSLLELLAFLEEFMGKKIPIEFSDWRPGDQKVYVSNNGKAKREFGWTPSTSCGRGGPEIVRMGLRQQRDFQKSGHHLR